MKSLNGKLNIDKVGTSYMTMIDMEPTPDKVEYGWYEGGLAFIALNGKRLTYSEAWKLATKLKVEKIYTINGKFYTYIGDHIQGYRMTIDGLVRCLIEKFNKTEP